MLLLLTSEVLWVLIVDKGGEIASVIEDHVKGFAARESSQGLLDTPSVLLLSLAFPGENWNASSCNANRSQKDRSLINEHRSISKAIRGCCMVLGREDVLEESVRKQRCSYIMVVPYTRRPGDLSTKCCECLDQNGSLDGPGPPWAYQYEVTSNLTTVLIYM